MADNTQIELYGDIGESWWGDGISESQVLDGLKSLDPQAKEHTMRINSTGGRADVGITIFNLARSHTAQMRVFNPEFDLITVNDGYAMSSASVIFMAGTKRIMNMGSILMIHDAWNFVYGNAEQLVKEAGYLDKLSGTVADLYAKMVGDEKKNADFFRGLMKEESYFTGEDAVTQGLATSYDSGSAAMLVPGLTPEKLKGHYNELMQRRDRQRTMKPRPVSKEELLKREGASKRLQLMIAELA